MKVSCICPTYNRVVSNKLLIEEALNSFLLQDYEDKELIIINDHEGQYLIFDHPQVKIINHFERFPSLGAKYNYAIKQASGEYICTWEDDDIALPNRISTSVEKISGYEYFNPISYFFMHDDLFQFEQCTGYSHNCSLYTKEAWRKVGGYPETSGPQDAQMDTLLKENCSTILGPLSVNEGFYVYRWGVSDMHLSGNGDTEQAYKDYALRETRDGEFILEPKWKQDYTYKARNLVSETSREL